MHLANVMTGAIGSSGDGCRGPAVREGAGEDYRLCTLPDGRVSALTFLLRGKFCRGLPLSSTVRLALPIDARLNLLQAMPASRGIASKYP